MGALLELKSRRSGIGRHVDCLQAGARPGPLEDAARGTAKFVAGSWNGSEEGRGAVRTVLNLVNGRAEVLRRHELDAGHNVPKVGVFGRGDESAGHDILDAVVAYEVVRNAVVGDADGFLDEAIDLEGIRVDERANQRPLGIFADGRMVQGGSRGSKVAHARSRKAIILGDSCWRALLLLQRPLLFARRKGLLELSIDEKVSEDAARAPRDAIGPAFDAGSVLFIDEDAAAADKVLALPVVRSARHMIEQTGQRAFKKHQGIEGRGYMALPRWIEGI